MPIYEYECPKCGRFDVLQRMSDKPLRTHDECGSAVKKLMSAGSFAFHGSGFYVTDYRNGSSSGGARNGARNGANGAKKEKDAAPACDAPKGAACHGCPSAGKTA